MCGSRIHARRQATIGHAQLRPGDLVSTRVVHTQVHSPGAVSMHGDPRRRSEGGQPSARRAMMSRSQPDTAASWPGHLQQIHSFFRNRSQDQMLATAAPWIRPLLPAG
jgi:hypothetical protein